MKRSRDVIDPTYLRWAQELQPQLKPTSDNLYHRITDEVLADIAEERDIDIADLPKADRWVTDCSQIFVSRAMAYYCGALYGLTLLRDIEPLGIFVLLYHQTGHVPIEIATNLAPSFVTTLAGWDGKMKEQLGVGPKFFPFYLRFAYLCNPGLFFKTVTREQVARARRIKHSRYRTSILEGGIHDEPNITEKMYLKLETEGKREVVNELGIVPPFGSFTRLYIAEQLLYYAEVDTSIGYDPNLLYSLYAGQDIAQLSDKVILETLDTHLDYTNREELIAQAREAIAWEGRFFFPLKRTHRTNTETLLGTAADDFHTDMVAYGSLVHYRLYEKDELMLAWTESTLVHPENPSLTFDPDAIHQLAELVQFRWDETFYYLLQNHLANREDLMRGDADRQKFIADLDQAEKTRIAAFLHHVFDAGMYMRRWKGPGHPYPVRADDTYGHETPQESVGVALVQARTELEQMSEECRKFCLHLRTMDRRSNERTPRYLGQNFERLWASVTPGPTGECIRMASSIFIATSWHYLFLLFDITIPNFDRFAVEFIT